MENMNNFDFDIDVGPSLDKVEEAINLRIRYMATKLQNIVKPIRKTKNRAKRNTTVKQQSTSKSKKSYPVPVHSRARVKKRLAPSPTHDAEVEIDVGGSNNHQEVEKRVAPSPSDDAEVQPSPSIDGEVEPSPSDDVEVGGSINDQEVEIEVDGSNNILTRSMRMLDLEMDMTVEERRDDRRKRRTESTRSLTDTVRDQRKFYRKLPDLIAKFVKPSDWSQILVINLASMTALTGSVLFSVRPPIPDSISNPDPSTLNVITESDHFPYLHLLPTNQQRTLTNRMAQVTIQVIEPNYQSIIPTTLAILSSPFSYRLLNTFGRKKTLMLAALPQILAGLLVGLDHMHVFYFTRVLSGLSDSIRNVALPTFIGEVATPHVRGSWGNSMAVNTYLGNSILNGIESYFKVSITSYVLVFLPIFILIIFSCFYEPPHYYLLKGKLNDAWKSLQFLRRTGDINEEFQSIKADVYQQKRDNIGFSKLFKNIGHRKSLLLAIMVRCCEQFCGVGALRLYTQQMLRETIEDISFNDATWIYSVIMTVTTTISATVLSKIGRRRAMCVSSYGCAVFLFLIALYYYLHFETADDVTWFEWVPMFGLIEFIPMYALGLGIVPTLILGEIFAMGIKAQALCVMHIVFTFLVVAMDVTFYYLFTNFGLSTPFFFYCGSCLVSLILNYFFLPDMDDLTLQEIQQTMKASVKKSVFERLKTAVGMGNET